MPPFNLSGSLRRLKPEKHTSPLNGRNDAELTFVDDEPLAGPALLLDSTVYIHVLTGKTPAKVDQLLEIRTLNHSAVVVGELTNRLGSHVPRDNRERQARARLIEAIHEIPDYRVLVPTVVNWGEAGVISGIIARLEGYPSGRTQDDLNDALIFLQASANGIAVLTANIGHFDRLQQLQPDARVLSTEPIHDAGLRLLGNRSARIAFSLTTTCAYQSAEGRLVKLGHALVGV